MPQPQPLLSEIEGPCARLLREGLYEYYTITKTSDFHQDVKTYFLSETFRDELRKHKWGGHLNVILDGVPLSLRADSSEDDVSVFQKRVAEATSVRIAHETYNSVATRIPNVALAREYNKCVSNTRGYGFVVSEEALGDKVAVLKVAYIKRISEDPLPRVQEALVRGGSDVTGLPDIGSEIEDEFVVSFARRADEASVLIINTDRESLSWPLPAPSVHDKHPAPIGTIIASFVSFEQLRLVTGDHEISGSRWLPELSRWTPCDGRNIIGSELAKIAGVSEAPDLRGVFLRGLNSFAIDESSPVPETQRDSEPNRTKVGSFQAQNVGEHKHTYRVNYPRTINQAESGSDIKDLWQGGGDGGQKHVPKTEGNPTGETRPNNVAVNYFIRTNS